MANLLGGRLVFNAQDKHWYLCETMGSHEIIPNPFPASSGCYVHQSKLKASWGVEQDSAVERGLNWKRTAPNYNTTYHFGRLGYYARLGSALTKSPEGTSHQLNLRAGLAGIGFAVMSTTALVNPVIAGNILPQGGVVTSGSGSINTINSGTGLQIKQNSQVLGLNWNSFSIGAGNKVVFEQPNSTAVAINRVIGNSRSEIFGSLQANGQVFLLNPNGVLMARTPKYAMNTREPL
jgi:filamentous hemagglutinin family protein